MFTMKLLLICSYIALFRPWVGVKFWVGYITPNLPVHIDYWSGEVAYTKLRKGVG